MLELKNTINTMVDQLNALRRRSHPRGARGGNGRRAGRPGERAGRRRHVEGPDGQRERRWPSNLTNQVRNIADVTTAVAKGDLSQKITVEAKGEMLELKNTINTMVDQLSHLRGRSDARGARGGNGRATGRPGERAGRRRHVEGSDRQRELHGGEPDDAGAQHRRRDDGRRARRPVAQDHRRRARRDPRAEEHHQHDGGSAQRVRGRSDPRGARGGHRRQARRPGAACPAPAACGGTSPTT